MKPFRAMLITVLLTMTLLFGVGLGAKTDADAIYDFYKAPTFKGFVDSISPYNENLPSHAKNDLIVFAVRALLRNPQMQAQAIKNFDGFSSDKKYFIAEVMQILGQGDLARKNGFKKRLTTLTLKTIRALDPLEEGAATLDLIWASYFATGDSDLLESILQYAVHSKPVLDEAIEFKSRNHLCELAKTAGVPQEKLDEAGIKLCDYPKELVQRMKAQYPQSYEKEILRVNSVYTALWSLEANAKRDPIIKQKIEDICKRKPQICGVTGATT